MLHRVRPHAGAGRSRASTKPDRPRPSSARLHRSGWPAAGIKRGDIHGATDEFGFHAVEHPHYVTDIHATVLHQLGLDPHRLAVPGRQRLEMDFGSVITDILT